MKGIIVTLAFLLLAIGGLAYWSSMPSTYRAPEVFMPDDTPRPSLSQRQLEATEETNRLLREHLGRVKP